MFVFGVWLERGEGGEQQRLYNILCVEGSQEAKRVYCNTALTAMMYELIKRILLKFQALQEVDMVSRVRMCQSVFQ